jgi:2-polyprenyl-3-methyl-5-hydroxy-6-metoxy-1,4-benzoquinol methylase
MRMGWTGSLLESGSFDVIFSKSVIEHLFDPSKFVSECRRVLKPGGRIIVMTPDWGSTMKIFFDDYSHRQPYTATALKDLLDVFGFYKTHAELFYQLPVLWKYPALKAVSRILQFMVPVTAKSKIKFIRWSVELMVLGTGVK